MLRNSVDGYGWVSRALHWLMAVLVIGVMILGLVVEEMRRLRRDARLGWHQEKRPNRQTDVHRHRFCSDPVI